ncbi:uncharacterized protein CC84DRAFT_610198 [Paraphaeosphaeria sporulosa]|uniref:Uncharacterized protein n=1 Tax=Paraphaeosphaeria sporulosa TaxID=1460663 RepID=A0A177CIG5_9PLEO|nr:uncharacterized protein CC84DRAFT_610198 [Paraphaeosphaeria sporulosa]OAG06639.1 hypothetical protein CC84DRAFT_610198 [Paraphaeosphaeria sporulosa]
MHLYAVRATNLGLVLLPRANVETQVLYRTKQRLKQTYRVFHCLAQCPVTFFPHAHEVVAVLRSSFQARATMAQPLAIFGHFAHLICACISHAHIVLGAPRSKETLNLHDVVVNRALPPARSLSHYGLQQSLLMSL